MIREFLSYSINEDTPLYGGEKAISIKNKSQISSGDSSNSKYFMFPGHCGTHIDFPKHFSDSGKSINDYPASFWFFKNIFVINYPAMINEIIDEKLFQNLEVPTATEFLIIKTGFGEFRSKNTYWENNPGLSDNLAGYIKTKLPNIRAIGFDFISLSAYQNRPVGRLAHKAFLVENDILIIEDMNLIGHISGKINKIYALPLQIDQADGVPITIMAEYE